MPYFNPYALKGGMSALLGALGQQSVANYFGSGTTNGGRSIHTKGRGRYRSQATLTDVQSKKRKTGGRSSFKDRVLKIAEAKHYTLGGIIAMTHSTIYTWNLTAGIAQGTGDGDRIGDKIHLAAMKVKGSYQVPADSGAYTYRIIVGYSGEEYTPIANPTAGGLTATELFQASTTNNWGTNAIINPKAFTMIYDERFDLNSLIPNNVEVRSFSFNINLNKDFPYQARASQLGKFKNLYIVMLSEIVGGTNGETATGTVPVSVDLIYKDL